MKINDVKAQYWEEREKIESLEKQMVQEGKQREYNQMVSDFAYKYIERFENADYSECI
jgi:hypothetical protein